MVDFTEVMQSISEQILQLAIVAGLVTGLTNQFKRGLSDSLSWLSFFIALALSFSLISLIDLGRELGMNIYQVILFSSIVAAGAVGFYVVTKPKTNVAVESKKPIEGVSVEQFINNKID